MPKSVLILAALLVVGLSSCWSDNDRDGGDAPHVSGEEWRSLPLTQAMGWDELGADELIAQERETQELIADCMAELGFEYQPSLDEVAGFVEPTPTDAEFGTREFAERRGLGISTFFEQQQEQLAVRARAPDPNQRYLESLSAAERAAYLEALHGRFPDAVDAAPQADLVPSGGCESSARARSGTALLGGDDSTAMAEFSVLHQDLLDRVEADPRVVEAHVDWSACMAEAGYSFTDQRAMYQAVTERMDAVYESMFVPGDDAGPTAPGQATDDRGEASPDSEAPAYDRALLDEVQAFELAVAVADHECGAAVQRARYEVQLRLEAEFVERHGALIAELRGPPR